jgi:4-hydroxybenzoate polyprenyltransferase
VKKRLVGVWRLTRFREYLCFVVITTSLGAAVGKASFGWRWMIVLIANWLTVGFAFMINDVEDAPDDALNPAKVKRNPVSAGDLSVRSGRAASFGGAVTAAVLYALLGLWPFIIGVTCLVIGYLYSWRRIRLKTIPVVDLISHGLMLAGLQFLTGYFTFGPGPAWRWIFPLTFLVAISLYGQLFNELRDFEHDVKAGVTHTASLIGPRLAHILMMLLFAIGVVSAAITVFVVRLIPTWVLLMVVGVATILLVQPALRVSREQSATELQEPFQKPLEIAAAFGLAVWFVGPWVESTLHVEFLPTAQRWVSVIAQWGRGIGL